MKILAIQPRCSGKTSKALYEYMKSPSDSLLIVQNSKNAYQLKKRIGRKINIIESVYIKSALHGKKFKNVILDDYLFFPNRKEIYQQIKNHAPENIYIFTTADKFYDSFLMEFIKTHKSHYTCNELHDKSKEMGYNLHIHGLMDLYNCFMTDSDTIIIDSTLLYNTENEDMKEKLGESRYELEIRNNYKKDFSQFDKNIIQPLEQIPITKKYWL